MNGARLSRERWSAGAQALWRDALAQESWGSCPGLEAGDAGLGHAGPFRELSLGQAEFLPPAAHCFGQLESQPGLLAAG